MNFIDKQTHAEHGDGVINQMLESCWIDDQGCYINANYDDGLCDNRQSFQDDLVALLLENQGRYCCYCMKYIIPAETTLEHIIPHNTRTQGDFDAYLTCPDLRDHVVFARSFDRLTKVIPPAKYGHDVAYYNLVASCDKNAHCNHYRGSKFIRPLFYDLGIADLLEYDRAGRASSELYGEELACLALSTNEDLRFYRRIWKELAAKFPNVAAIGTDEIEEVVLTSDFAGSFERQLNNFFESPKLDDILKYRWFFDYYKPRLAQQAVAHVDP